MKYQKKRILAALMTLVLCMGLLMEGAVSSEATQASGYCGNDVTWVFENGLLTISGSGPMDGYNDLFVPPWYEYADYIQRVVVTEGVTTIGKRAFHGLTSLRIVTLPASVKSLDAMAFADCTGLTQISMPGVENIGVSCFHGCIALVNINLPSGLRTIGDQAFYRCEKLSGITIPVTVERMGIMAFAYCKRLVYVDIRARLTVLPHWSFYGCVMLWEVYLPSSVEQVDTNAFGECPSLYYVDYGGLNAVKEEIAEQLSQPTTMEPSQSDVADVTHTEHENSIITTTITSPKENDNANQQGSSVTIDATVTNPDGWKDVVEAVVESPGSSNNPNVMVHLQDKLAMNDGALSDLVGKDVTLMVHTSQNVGWEIVMKDQPAESVIGAQNFDVSISTNLRNSFADTLSNAKSFMVKLGYTSLYTTVQLPVGSDMARQVATLYRVDDNDLFRLSSVYVDDQGMASFCLAGTTAGDYVVALNVPGIDLNEVLVPKSLAGAFDITYGATLMDSQGNHYVLTGRVNKLGFGLGTLTWIIVGVLGGSVILVGVIMVIWNKQQQKMYKQRRKSK